MLHHDIVCVLRDHRGWLPGLWVDIFEEVGNDSRELLLGLLMEVGNGDTRGENSVVRMCDGHICGGLGSLKREMVRERSRAVRVV